jgi:hypothetical protein
MVLELCTAAKHSTLRTNWKGFETKRLQSLFTCSKNRASLVERGLLFRCLQCVAINLNKLRQLFEGRAKFPNFKSKHHKQSIQYPQNVKVAGDLLDVPKIGVIKAVFINRLKGNLKQSL